MQLRRDDPRPDAVTMRMGIVLMFMLMFVGFVVSAFAQIPQKQRIDERRQQMIQADEERQKAEKDPKASESKQPVMNVDIQMVLAKLDYKTFAEAKPNIATQITDGDPLWLYVKFNGKLERYVYTLHSPDAPDRYILFVEFGPQGDVTAKSHQIIEFRKDELAMTELKMSLSLGRAGHNNALGIFIKNVSAAKPGRWNNELRITNVMAFPRGPNDFLAKLGFTCDFTKGLAKYPVQPAAFRSMVLRDSLDESKLPIEGKFDDASVRKGIIARLAGEGIVPTRVYFAADSWLEYSDLPASVRQFRTTTGIFLYRKDSICLYGLADITQAYDAMNDRYGESKIELRKDILTTCGK